MLRAYINSKIIMDTSVINGCVITESGKIKEICSRFEKADEIIDCKGLFLSPGFADIHVHGGGGKSAMSLETEDIITMCRAHALRGTTSIVPTTLAAPVERLQKSIDAISKAKNKCFDSNILGIHLEGPFISPAKKGAQSPDNILIPTKENLSSLLDYSDNILMIGAAPEIKNGMTVGEEAAKRGIVASIAHSDADFSIAEKALEHGFSDITHIFSASSAMRKNGIFRAVGVAEAGLALDGFSVQFIGDLRHLPYGALKLIYKCKGADKAYAISDGLEYSAMDLDEGCEVMQENGLKVLYEDNVMKLADRSCLAGSVATSNVLVRNLVKECAVQLPDAVKMASFTPLNVIGFGDRKGKIAPGYDEDIILFDEDINVKYVSVCGRTILNIS